MKRLLSSLLFLAVTHAFGAAHELTFNLASFFRERLVSTAPPPSYEALLKVIDTIPDLNSGSIENALPLISDALKSTKNNLPIEAVFALHEIAKRPDGGTLLRSRVPEIGALLASGDDRLSGGSIEILGYMTPSTGELTVPEMIKFLQTPGRPNLVKVATASTLLQFRRGDLQSRNAVEQLLTASMEPDLQARMLQVIGTNHVNSAMIDHFVLRSLGDSNNDVKIAAILTAHQLGSNTWNQALPLITKLATDPSEDKRVQNVAQREIKNNTDNPPRQ